MTHNLRIRFVLFAALLLASFAAVAQNTPHPNLRRGFTVDGVFQAADVDHVNMFNGNLIVQVPLGQRYTVSNALSYQFVLTYNSKVWDYEGVVGTNRVIVRPTQNSNAGLGWLLSFGRILDINHPANSSGGIVYEGPDGSEHVIYCTLHEDELPPRGCTPAAGDTSNVKGFTRDGSYLRMRLLSNDQYQIEFPDGNVHTFASRTDQGFLGEARLVQMADRFGNTMSIDYSTANQWKISDSTGRQHVVTFEPWTNAPNSATRNYLTRVKTVELAKWQAGTGTDRAIYDFTYVDQQFDRGCLPENMKLADDSRVTVPTLRKIDLPTTIFDETWDFTYHSDSNKTQCQSGGLLSLESPTGSKVDYTYQVYKLPAAGCNQESAFNETGGIATRTVTDRGRTGSPQYKWTYETRLETKASSWDTECRGSITAGDPYAEVVNSVRVSWPGHQQGQKVSHYFSVWALEAKGPNQHHREEYGLPFARSKPSDGRFLSTVTTDENGNGEKVKVYVNYEMDPISSEDNLEPSRRDANARLKRQRTLYVENSKHADVNYDDFDGMGHYREVEMDGNFDGANKRLTFTNYNPGRVLHTGPIPPGQGGFLPTWGYHEPWIIETYTQRKVTDPANTSTPALITEFCFDGNGFLGARRTLKGATPGSTDLLAVFGQTGGNLTSEKYYGGDKDPTSSNRCAPEANEAPTYELAHVYESGTLKTSGYVGAGFFTVFNEKIDRNTGLVTQSKDMSEQLITAYTYDALGRVDTITPPAGHGPKFDYTYGFTNNSPTVDVKASVGNNEIDRKFVRFDSLGRAWREFKRMPDDITGVDEPWSARAFEYDPWNRQVRVSTPEKLRLNNGPNSFTTVEATFATVTTYDYLGRPVSITSPDRKSHHTTHFDYTGASIAREKVHRGEKDDGDTSVDNDERETVTTRTYDRFGRLHSVVEDARATRHDKLTGDDATTTYTYDLADRLVKVTMNGEATQTREFKYDPRGFLTEEKHPETGTTTYAKHDARGHARERVMGGKLLEFDYDKAERLKTVEDSVDVLKSFTFATANNTVDGKNNRRKGKLETAYRRNDLPTAGRYGVTETYTYTGAAGQMSDRTTVVKKGTTTVQQFAFGIKAYDNFLLPSTLTMPTCSGPGCTSQTTSKGIPEVSFVRENGLLTAVTGFANLSYHASGMVARVEHATSRKPFDTYSEANGIPRPSKIAFASCGQTKPTFHPDETRVRPRIIKTTNADGSQTTTCGLHVTWAPATVCGSTANVRYSITRTDGKSLPLSTCLEYPEYYDRDAKPGIEYTYNIVAYGPGTNGQPSCTIATRSEETRRSEPTKFASCETDTILLPNPVTASIGAPALFTATLSSANGFIEGEPLVFTAAGKLLGIARTGPSGFAQLTAVINHLDPGTWPLKVGYFGLLLPSKEVTVDLKVVCDVKSYTVVPVKMNVLPAGSPLNMPFQVSVAASDRCAWNPVPDPGFLTVSDVNKTKGTFGINVAKNTTSDDRQSKVNVGFQNVTVKQSGTGCSYSFNPDVAYLPADTGNGNGVIQVIAPPECRSRIVSSESWMTIVEPQAHEMPMEGSYQVSFHATKNMTDKKRVAYLTVMEGTEEKASAAVNQRAQPKAECPIIIRENLRGGTVDAPGQNISVRIHTTGTELKYTWYVDNSPLPECSGLSCADFLIDSDSNRFPAPGKSVSIQVKVRNLCDEDGVVSERVFWHNNSSPTATCRVPVIQSTLMRENESPETIFSSRRGATVGFSVIGLNLSGPASELKYQWYHGLPGDRDAKVTNGTTDTIRISPFDTSFYWLELRNNCGAQISRSGAVFITEPPGRGRPCCRFDMNNDGHSDVPWSNTLTGQTELWLMNGVNRSSTVALPPVNTITSRVQSVGDMNADGDPDILVRDPASGANQVWIMNNTSRSGAINLESRAGSQWSIGAVADYDADGHDDVVWHNNATGANELWFHESTEHAGTWALPKSGNSGLYGTGDFNGDELPDLFFHDRATGQNAIWMMNDDGTRRTVALKEAGTPAKRSVTTKIVSTNSMADPGFVPALVADMDRDGKPDIFWRNPDTGENKVWIMNGTVMKSTVTATPRNEPGWEVGGGGSNNAGPQTPGGGGPVGSGPTTLSVVADAATVGKASAVTATLLSNGQPVAEGELVFSLNGSEAARLLTDTDGSATAIVDVGALAAGTYPGAISVRFDGNSSFGPSSATADLVVTAPSAVVSWLNPADIVYGTPLSATQLNATAGVPGTFVYTPAAGAILDAGYQTLSVTFTPSDPAVAPITREAVILVHKAPSSVTWATPAAIPYGAPLSAAELNATSTLTGFYTYTPGAGTLLPAGTNLLSVLFEPDSPNYEPSSTTTTILVEKGTQRIVWDDPDPITILVPLSEVQLNAGIHPSGTAPAGAVTYDPPLGTLLPEGLHKLRVSVAATESYDAASASVDILVLPVRSNVTWSAPAPIVYGTPLSAAQLNATADVPGTFAYDPPAGTVLGAGSQQLNVVFTPADPRYQPATAAVELEVLKAPQTISWNKPAAIVYGTPLSATQLNATVQAGGPARASSPEYDPAIGTVLPAGAQLLRVTAPETDNYSSATMTVVLDVLKATPVVTWAAPAPIVYRTALSATQLNATASVPGSFVYTPAAGTVLQAGNGQTLSVRFTPTDTSNYNVVDASTTIDVLRADPILAWATPASIVYRTPLSATQLNATADVPGTFVYTPAAGTVLQAGAGQTLSVQFTPGDTRNFNNASATTTIEVVKADPILAWATPATIVYRTALGPAQLNATADVPGTFVYTPPAGTVLQAGAGQTLSVHFTPSDTRNFNDADASTTIEVIKATPILTWQAPAGIVYGTPLGDTQLSATADVPGTFDYTPPAGTILDAGAGHTLALHFTPEDTHNFNTVDTTRTIDVAKAKQTLSWTPPAPIVYGTPLSVAQLNATVQVVGPSPAGALTYTPAAGIVLDAGLGQTLTVNAAETKNYEPATLSVALDVLRKALSLTVDPKSKLYGGIVPPLTGTLLGVVNNDPITPSYSTTGTVQSPAGVYPINGALVDPNNRLPNYDVTITPSTLTVLPAPLTIAADPKSKQYSDPLPLLTPTYTGFVLGETPAVLSGTLVIQTTAAVLSAPGPYAITIGGLSSPNYAITYIGSTLTVLPEDARVINTSPLAISTAASGATTVTLTATIQDISATADAAGDTFPGDIRNATLTFVDRATNATLCVAPIGLVSSSDERTGIATCNFTRDFGATLPATLVIGSKIGSHYVRDAAADDVTLTVSAQSSDRVVGGGVTAFASAAGTHAPDLNEAAQFEYQFSYDKNGAVATNLRLSFQRTEGGVKHNYLLTVDSATSLSTARTTGGGTAIVVGKGTLVDSTDKETIVTGVPMILTLTDVGNGNKTEVDAFGVTLLKPEGGIVFAAGWSGVRTTEQPIRSGQVSVNFSGK